MLLPFIHWLVLLQRVGLCVGSLLCGPTFAIILLRERELASLLLLSSCCHVTVCVLWLFRAVPRIGLRSVIMLYV